MRGISSISWADCSAGGMGASRIEVRREAVEGYELADASIIDSMLEVSSVEGSSLASSEWNKSGCLESDGRISKSQ
jgi:hypothetical protein